MSKKYIHNLGRWEPEVPTEKEFKDYLLAKGINVSTTNITFRDPQWYRQNYLELKNKTGYDASADVWHRDGGGVHFWLIFWTNTTPTQLQPARRLRPYHIYAFKNERFKHRTPPSVLTKPNINRYFLRVYYKGAINV